MYSRSFVGTKDLAQDYVEIGKYRSNHNNSNNGNSNTNERGRGEGKRVREGARSRERLQGLSLTDPFVHSYGGTTVCTERPHLLHTRGKEKLFQGNFYKLWANCAVSVRRCCYVVFIMWVSKNNNNNNDKLQPQPKSVTLNIFSSFAIAIIIQVL